MKHQYNIPKPTNTGSLIGAVFVGLLALACNQYRKLDPDAVDGWISKIVPKKTEKVEKGPRSSR